MPTDARYRRHLPAFGRKAMRRRLAQHHILADSSLEHCLSAKGNGAKSLWTVDRNPVLSGKALMSYQIGDAKITETILESFTPSGRITWQNGQFRWDFI